MAPNHPTSTSLSRLTASFGRRAAAFGQRMQRYFVVRLLVRTVQEMSDDDATHMAASVSYYALFSIFPLLLGLIVIFSMFLEASEVQTKLTDFTVDYLPGSEELIDANIDASLKLRGALTVVAALGLIWSGSAIFGALTRAVNRAWDVHKDRPFHISKLRQLAMALAVGVMFLVSLSSSTLVRLAERFADSDMAGAAFLINGGGQILLQGTASLLTLGTFLIIYKFMPNTKTYWRYIWPGAVVGALLFELAKNLFILYLNRFSSFENVYGTLAPVIVLLLWAYVSSLILIMGAELSSEYGRLLEGVDRGVLLHPRDHSSEGEAA